MSHAFLAAGPGLLLAIIPLMIVIPACVVLIARRITGRPGDDSFRLRIGGSRPAKKSGIGPRDEL